MKSKIIVLSALVMFMPVVGIGLAHAQADETVTANVPFAFYAGQQLMPAGKYRFGVNIEDNEMTISDDSGRRALFVMTDALSDGGNNNAVVFDHAGSAYYLKAVNSQDFDVSVPANRRRAALESAQAASRDQLKSELGQ